VTYRGDRARISSNTSTLEKDSAFKIANLIMFQKIANTLSIISFLMVSTMSVGAFLAIRYMQSPEFERTLKNKLMGSLENKMPDVMKNTLPDFTGPSIEIPKKQVSPLGNTQN